MLVAWHLLEDSQFPPYEEYLLEAAKFTSLWSTKDPERIKESNIFWILTEMDLRTVISQRPRLFPTLFEQLRAFAEFKADFHNVSIRAWKDTKHIWHKLPYLVSETNVQEIVGSWLAEWCQPIDIGAGTSKGGEICVA